MVCPSNSSNQANNDTIICAERRWAALSGYVYSMDLQLRTLGPGLRRGAGVLSRVQREVKRRALFGLSLRPDLAPVPAHDALHRSQSDTGAGEISGVVEPLEGAEQFRFICGIETGAVVADEIGAVASCRIRCEPARVPRVNFQALPNRFSSATRIRLGSHSSLQVGLDGHVHHSRRSRLPQVAHNRVRRRAQVDLAALQRTPRHP